MTRKKEKEKTLVFIENTIFHKKYNEELLTFLFKQSVYQLCIMQTPGFP